MLARINLFPKTRRKCRITTWVFHFQSNQKFRFNKKRNKNK